MNILTTSTIRSVTQYTASPVATCDRCSAGIKYVFVVTYKDGETQRFGSECINKILAGRTDLISLFKKNAKKLKKYQDYRAILTGGVDDMPRGSEYFGSGLFFIADSEGKDIFLKTHWFFHPLMDLERNAAGDRYVSDPAEFAAKSEEGNRAGPSVPDRRDHPAGAVLGEGPPGRSCRCGGALMAYICTFRETRYEPAEYESDNLKTCRLPSCGMEFDGDEEAHHLDDDCCENHELIECLLCGEMITEDDCHALGDGGYCKNHTDAAVIAAEDECERAIQARRQEAAATKSVAA